MTPNGRVITVQNTRTSNTCASVLTTGQDTVTLNASTIPISDRMSRLVVVPMTNTFRCKHKKSTVQHERKRLRKNQESYDNTTGSPERSNRTHTLQENTTPPAQLDHFGR